jgi:hypothetical protein
MEHDSDGRVLLAGRMVASLDTPGRAGENNLGHEYLNLDSMV